MMKNSKGITLLESFLAAFIFVTSVAAIFVSMNALRKPAVKNEIALNGSLVLKNFLEDLRASVDLENFNTESNVYLDGSKLSVNHPAVANVEVGGVNYSISYVVSNADIGFGAIKVNATVSWDDTL